MKNVSNKTIGYKQKPFYIAKLCDEIVFMPALKHEKNQPTFAADNSEMQYTETQLHVISFIHTCYRY